MAATPFRGKLLKINCLLKKVYLIVKKRRLFTDYHELIELEKLDIMNLSLFEKNIKSKLQRVNFITVLCDRATNAAIIKKECFL